MYKTEDTERENNANADEMNAYLILGHEYGSSMMISIKHEVEERKPNSIIT